MLQSISDLVFIELFGFLSSQVCHPSGAKIFNELIEGSEMVMVENCGHCMTMDRPRKCAKLVKDFIQKQNPPTATEVH